MIGTNIISPDRILINQSHKYIYRGDNAWEYWDEFFSQDLKYRLRKPGFAEVENYFAHNEISEQENICGIWFFRSLAEAIKFSDQGRHRSEIKNNKILSHFSNFSTPESDTSLYHLKQSMIITRIPERLFAGKYIYPDNLYQTEFETAYAHIIKFPISDLPQNNEQEAVKFHPSEVIKSNNTEVFFNNAWHPKTIETANTIVSYITNMETCKLEGKTLREECLKKCSKNIHSALRDNISDTPAT